MPRTSIVIYQDKTGKVPLLEWIDALPPKVQDKCTAAIEKLAEMGYELRRPNCDLLEHGIYELRVRYGNIHYRILYAFVGQQVVLLSHGLIKERRVPKKEIAKAIASRNNYAHNPKAHTYLGEW